METELHQSPTPAGARQRRKRCFTISEVMMATMVMAFSIATSITVIEQGYHALDTARNTTIAAQVLQSVMEDLRLQTWAQVTALESATNNGQTGNVTIDSSFTGYNATAAQVLSHFTVTRTISDVSGQANMKSILLQATWTGIDGRSHTLVYRSFYAKDGIYDFYVS